MPHILSIETAVPPHRVSQNTAREFARRIFRDSRLDVERLMPIFANTQVQHRHFCVPPEWFDAPHGFREKNKIYREQALALAESGVRRLLQETGIDASAIGHIFFVSTTGLATPSIDAHLFNRLPFRADIRRTPIWGLGCAGGVGGLSRAYDWLRAYPDSLALVISLELCGLTFIRNDLSKSNFVATSLFADGCGLALLAGDNYPRQNDISLQVLAGSSVTWPDSLGVMGWEIHDGGLKVIFSKSIPQIVQKLSRPALQEFLQENNLDFANIDFFLSHPGGAKVIQAYEEALVLGGEQTSDMKAVLRNYGNMSSATVFFVLKHFLQSERYRRGARALLTALGPGFSMEMLLARCT